MGGDPNLEFVAMPPYCHPKFKWILNGRKRSNKTTSRHRTQPCRKTTKICKFVKSISLLPLNKYEIRRAWQENSCGATPPSFNTSRIMDSTDLSALSILLAFNFF